MSGGRFITLEGIEGAGKSTCARHLLAWLQARGIRVRLTREPGGTPLAERVREIVLNRGDEKIAPLSETLLMFAARGIHVENLIRPTLAAGEWIICDRFTDATRAYQGGGRGVSQAVIEQLASEIHGNLQPDCTLLLDLPVSLGLSRVRTRGAPTDRFEQEREPFFERVRAVYLDLARREPGRFRVIDASQPLEGVTAQLESVLESLIRHPS